MIRFRLDPLTAGFLANNGQPETGVYYASQVNAILKDIEPLLRMPTFLDGDEVEKAEEYSKMIQRHLKVEARASAKGEGI